jgi:hypothetical protein
VHAARVDILDQCGLARTLIDGKHGDRVLAAGKDPFPLELGRAAGPVGEIDEPAVGMSLSVREGSNVATVPPSLALYRILNDGKLDFVRKYDIDPSGGRSLFWMGDCLAALNLPTQVSSALQNSSPPQRTRRTQRANPGMNTKDTMDTKEKPTCFCLGVLGVHCVD